MITALLLVVALLVLALVALLVWGLRRFTVHEASISAEYAEMRHEFVAAHQAQLEAPGPDRLLAERLRDRFVITTASGEAFSGLLMEVDAKTVVLADAHTFTKDGTDVPVDGEVILRRDGIAYMQRPQT